METHATGEDNIITTYNVLLYYIGKNAIVYFFFQENNVYDFFTFGSFIFRILLIIVIKLITLLLQPRCEFIHVQQ